MTIEATPGNRSDLVDRLARKYSDHSTRADVELCVATAREAMAYFGADDDVEMHGVVERIAERDLRLRVGIDREVARLDPEDHRRL